MDRWLSLVESTPLEMEPTFFVAGVQIPFYPSLGLTFFWGIRVFYYFFNNNLVELKTLMD